MIVLAIYILIMWANIFCLQSNILWVLSMFCRTCTDSITFLQLWEAFLVTHCWRDNWRGYIFRWLLVLIFSATSMIILKTLLVQNLFNYCILLIADGVPKEGLRIQDVLVRIGTLLLIRDKVSSMMLLNNYQYLIFKNWIL